MVNETFATLRMHHSYISLRYLLSISGKLGLWHLRAVFLGIQPSLGATT